METHFTITSLGGGRGLEGPEGMSSKKKKNPDKASDTFEHVKKPFTFLADSVAMN